MADSNKVENIDEKPSVLREEAVVVRIRRSGGKVIQDCDVYIGRQMTMGGWNLKASKWANPFTVKECGSAQEALSKYRKYINTRADLLDSIDELEGKRLGCWCKPGPCHGDVLLEILQSRIKNP